MYINMFITFIIFLTCCFDYKKNNKIEKFKNLKKKKFNFINYVLQSNDINSIRQFLDNSY